MTLTSQYAWLYNQYPFSNDPNAGLLHPDWWITECACVPAADHAGADDHHAVPAEPLLRRAAPAARPDVPGRRHGPADRRRPAAAPRGPSSTCSTRELVGAAARRRSSPPTCWLFGADPTGRRDSAGAFDKAIAFAKQHAPQGLRPAGHLPGEPAHHRRRRDDRGRRQLVHDHQGPRGRPRRRPRPDGSVHTGVGFYGKDAAAGGSRNVHLSGFAIEGDVRERIDTDQVNGIGGALSDSTDRRPLHPPHQGRHVVRRPDDAT